MGDRTAGCEVILPPEQESGLRGHTDRAESHLA